MSTDPTVERELGRLAGTVDALSKQVTDSRDEMRDAMRRIETAVAQQGRAQAEACDNHRREFSRSVAEALTAAEAAGRKAIVAMGKAERAAKAAAAPIPVSDDSIAVQQHEWKGGARVVGWLLALLGSVLTAYFVGVTKGVAP